MGAFATSLNVFVDTQVLLQHHYDLGHETFATLFDLVDASNIKLFATPFTVKEYMEDIQDRAHKIHEQVKGLKRDYLIKDLNWLVGVEMTVNDLATHMRKKFEQKWLSRVELIHPSDGALDRVMDKYFSKAPPFGEGKKKHEFPDAFVADALLAEFKKRNGRLCVVSKDGDWKRLSEVESCIEHYSALTEVLAKFPNAKLAEAIKAGVLAKYPGLLKQYVDSYLQSIKDWRRGKIAAYPIPVIYAPSYERINVFSTKDGIAAIEVEIKFKYDLANYPFDAIAAHEMTDLVAQRPRPVVGATDSLTGLVHVKFDPKNPSDVSDMTYYSYAGNLIKWLS